MQPKKENYWFMFRMLLLLNIVLIGAILLAHPGKTATEKKSEPCSNTRKANVDVLNAITIKLM